MSVLGENTLEYDARPPTAPTSEPVVDHWLASGSGHSAEWSAAASTGGAGGRRGRAGVILDNGSMRDPHDPQEAHDHHVPIMMMIEIHMNIINKTMAFVYKCTS